MRWRRPVIELEALEAPPPIPARDAATAAFLAGLEEANSRITRLEELISRSEALLREQREIRAAYLAALDVMEKPDGPEHLPSPRPAEGIGTSPEGHPREPRLHTEGDDADSGAHHGEEIQAPRLQYGDF